MIDLNPLKYGKLLLYLQDGCCLYTCNQMNRRIDLTLKSKRGYFSLLTYLLTYFSHEKEMFEG